MPTPLQVPKYRLHKPSGLAVVRLRGRDVYLGKHGTRESQDEYQRVISEWLANSRQAPDTANATGIRTPAFTINELFVAYWDFAKGYYVKNAHPTGEQHCIIEACRHIVSLYGKTRVIDFGPRSLKAVRQSMIEHDLCRRVINARVNRIRRMIRWGVENEMVPSSILHGLQAVAALKYGRSEARESDAVKAA